MKIALNHALRGPTARTQQARVLCRRPIRAHDGHFRFVKRHPVPVGLDVNHHPVALDDDEQRPIEIVFLVCIVVIVLVVVVLRSFGSRRRLCRSPPSSVNITRPNRSLAKTLYLNRRRGSRRRRRRPHHHRRRVRSFGGRRTL